MLGGSHLRNKTIKKYKQFIIKVRYINHSGGKKIVEMRSGLGQMLQVWLAKISFLGMTGGTEHEHYSNSLICNLELPRWYQWLRNCLPMQETKRDVGLFPGWGRYTGGVQGNPLQISCQEHPMDRGAWRATVHRVTKNWTQLKRLSMHTQYISLSMKKS